MGSRISAIDAADPGQMRVDNVDNSIFSDVYQHLSHPDASIKRRAEIIHYLDHRPASPLGPNGRLYEAAWLKTHFDDLAQGSPDKCAITPTSVVDVYAKGTWSNGMKLSADDEYMLKRTISHFDELSSKSIVDKKDVEDLLHGAKITKGADGLITSVFRDGKIVRSFDGNVWTKEKDGSQTFELSPGATQSMTATITMNADGTGTLKVPDLDALPLVRKTGGVWQMTDPEGNTVQLHFNQKSGHVSTSDGLDVRMGPEGGSIHDTQFPDDPTDITMGSDLKIVTIVDNKSVTLDKTEQGVLYARNQDGSQELDYAGEASVLRDAQGNLRFDSDHANFPTVTIDKNGGMQVLDSSHKPVQMYLDVDTGEQCANVGAIAKVRRSKDGTLKISYLADDYQVHASGGLFVWHPNFDASVRIAPGKMYTYKAPINASANEMPTR